MRSDYAIWLAVGQYLCDRWKGLATGQLWVEDCSLVWPNGEVQQQWSRFLGEVMIQYPLVRMQPVVVQSEKQWPKGLHEHLWHCPSQLWVGITELPITLQYTNTASTLTFIYSICMKWECTLKNKLPDSLPKCLWLCPTKARILHYT